MRIVLCYQTAENHVRQIQNAAPHAEVIDAGQERVADELPDADIFCGHAKVPVPWDEICRRGRLKWIQSSAAGLDHCLTPPVLDSDSIVVTSASGLFADQVAEQTFALLLGLLRRLPLFFRAQLKKEYIRLPTDDLHGKTVGIVGLGGNGRRLVPLLANFRTRILATDWFPYDKPEQVESLWPAARLPDLLAESDIVILCAPLTPQTRGMMGKAEFTQMKPGSLLINVGRGPLVVEREMVAALESHHLGGAGLDVAEVEPLPNDSPLWDRDDVLITPHVGAQSARRNDDVTDFFCENLRRYAAGEPLLNQVDKQLGFPTRAPR